MCDCFSLLVADHWIKKLFALLNYFEDAAKKFHGGKSCRQIIPNQGSLYP